MILITLVGCYGITLAQDSAVPASVQQMFMNQHRDAMNVTWEQLDQSWWKVSYVSNGKDYTYTINNSGQMLYDALPVEGTYVSPDVLNNIVTRFGTAIYDVKKITGANNRETYVVRLFQPNGTIETEWVDATGAM